jgi:release factor glutamine methyltransferase
MSALDEETDFEGLRLDETIFRLSRDLAERGIESPQRDARLLIAAAIGARSVDLIANPGRRLNAHDARKLAHYRARRTAREPVSRILGERDFFGRSFRITPATLDPRPESETLIELALEIADEEGWRGRPVRILDVGTGSGCLLLTLLAELPLATGLGTDISAAALAVAAENAQRLGVASRARFEERRSLDGLGPTFDLLVSNPPYVPSSEIATLAPEVRNFDPRAALDGGDDGLGVYRELARSLTRAVPQGWVLCEVGAGQAEAVVEILSRAQSGVGPEEIRSRKDLGGHTRCVAIKTQL